MTALLSGVRVLDLTRLLPGPLATMHMADQGAEVIKIEDPERGDYARQDMAFGMTMSPIFHAMNRGKKSIRIDLTSENGRDSFLRLLRTADVVVESFRPGVMDKLGLSAERLREEKGDLILCSMSAYGQTGPRRHEPAHDNNMLALTGIADQFPRVEGRIAPPNYQIADIAGGSLTALSAISMALFRRERTGEGCVLDISLSDGALASAVIPFATMQMRGTPPKAGEDILTGLLPCYGYYETKDGRQIAMGALEPKFWLRFCEAVERMDLASKGLAFGPEGEAAKAEVAALFRSKTFEQWTALLDGVDACVTPVLTLEETLEDPQIAARGMVYEAADPEDGRMRRLASPITVDGQRAQPQAPAPRHGEHDALLNDMAGGEPS
ncbi:MAG: CoA transferase [Parvularcula sp.]|jgi:crotonobetainyl-CoA:carnitine CoA-transferase CaiB-like acyl-CoA transferase|nr:CoA transferase [Parvularcula sp.]